MDDSPVPQHFSGHTAGSPALFVSIRSRRMGAAEALVTVFVFHFPSPVDFYCVHPIDTSLNVSAFRQLSYIFQ